MNYRSVSKSRIHVSLEKMYNTFRDHGINFSDRANVYADGKPEETLGKLIRDERDQVTVNSNVLLDLWDQQQIIVAFRVDTSCIK